jgi:four helix bundle protein
MLKNKNRGYQQLRVWQDAVNYYILTCQVFKGFPFELKKVASHAIASSDSVHRNIAEGYCRRSIKEYIQFLYISLSSLGESVSGLYAYHQAGQINDEGFTRLDTLAYKLENGLTKLIGSLEQKTMTGGWTDSFIIRECNALYGESSKLETTTPSLQYSRTYPGRNN